MNLEDTVLSIIGQSQKTNTARFHSHEVLRAVKIIETESRTGAARSERRAGELGFNGDRVSDFQGEQSPGDKGQCWPHNTVSPCNTTDRALNSDSDGKVHVLCALPQF